MSHEHALHHLLLRLRPINRTLRAAASRLFRAAVPDAAQVAPAPGTCLTPEEAAALLDTVDALPRWCPAPLPAPDDAERASEQALRSAVAPGRLPLDALRARLGLTDFEVEALLLCAAPEVDVAYERLFAFILDDFMRRAPCVELLCSLTAASAAERHLRRHALAPHGRLVRTGLLRLGPEVGSEWRREVSLTPAAVQWLLGGPGPVERFGDPAEVPLATPGRLPPWGVDEDTVARAVAVLLETPAGAVAIHGPRQSAQAELPSALAARAGLSLRMLPWSTVLASPRALSEAVDTARALGAALWIAMDAQGTEPAQEARALEALEEASLQAGPLLFSGPRPFRPLRLMSARPWLEVAAAAPSLAEGEALWARLLPELEADARATLALRFRLAPAELRAAVRLFRAEGGGDDARASMERACRRVARRRTERFVTAVVPVRSPEELVLPEGAHRGVLDVARFAEAWPRVAEQWGLARLHRGAQGVRALFTGPSGTGKTLAAEVVAGMLGQELHKVDLAQLVSKWVGETEKNLDATFEEAEQAQAVLFFDEGDALFGKRGEVQRGTDRYANLEVSYLLQRLEAYCGLVIVATNLKDNIDEAFSRRFHAAVDFPRPEEPERLRLWRLALPASVPREGVDLASLARLDMTGATIMNAARTAALLAACDGQVVRSAHVIEGITREYRRESRLLLARELAAVAAGPESAP
ncbi:ATP-binding protein [Pyxidicoccus xibeiensis]|uniref:ATP-binding protein n=1 Tax=Pyxidicoccus xibeiensis TaxID=2906759 RepID=UPI0020A806E9|nr:AAA family ATPase [Pyxidicoccus xibeiensis]MCP3143382.1 AAA family ATPase [Pyxidicoccus xibeiensis]